MKNTKPKINIFRDKILIPLDVNFEKKISALFQKDLQIRFLKAYFQISGFSLHSPQQKKRIYDADHCMYTYID